MSSSEFNYLIGEKNELLFFVLRGKIRSQEVPRLEEILPLIQLRSQRIVIFNFQDVLAFLPGAHAAFAKMQALVRKEGKILGLCHLNDEVKFALLQGGVVRESEIYSSLPVAWQSLKAKLHKDLSR